VCEACNEHVQTRQIAEYQAARCQPAVDDVNQMWLSLSQVNDQLRNLQLKIDENLPIVLKCLLFVSLVNCCSDCMQ